MKINLIKVLLPAILVLAVTAFFWPAKKLHPNTDPVVLGQVSSELPLADSVPKLKAGAVSFETNAEVALAFDLDSNKILFEKNAGKPWPPASFTKLMSILVVYNLVSPSEVVTVQKIDTEVVTPKMGLVEGERIKVRDLAEGALIASANDAMGALARGVAGSTDHMAELMNLMANRLQLENSTFRNPWGFDQEGQLVTAFDILTVAREFLKHDDLKRYVSTELATIYSADGVFAHQVQSTNQLLSQEYIKGMKTGFTDEAKGNLIILYQKPDGPHFLTIVMGSENREADSQALIDWILTAYDF